MVMLLRACTMGWQVRELLCMLLAGIHSFESSSYVSRYSVPPRSDGQWRAECTDLMVREGALGGLRCELSWECAHSLTWLRHFSVAVELSGRLRSLIMRL